MPCFLTITISLFSRAVTSLVIWFYWDFSSIYSFTFLDVLTSSTFFSPLNFMVSCNIWFMWLLIVLTFSQLFSSSHYPCSVCLFHSWSIYWMDCGRATASSSTLTLHSCSGTSRWVLNFAGVLIPDMHSPFRTFSLLLTVCLFVLFFAAVTSHVTVLCFRKLLVSFLQSITLK